MSTHKRVYFSGIVPYMGLAIEKLLAENLGKIFEARGITSAAKAETELRVPKSTIDRAWHCRSMARLDTLGEVAAGLKMQPWQLLVPSFDVENPPQLLPAADQKTSKTKLKPIDVSSLGAVDAAELIRIVAAFSNADTKGRHRILDACEEAEARALKSNVNSSSNKPQTG
ncbi:hypothetical protein [Herminiimonas contaminans]|uniref:Uncharacterized protein n=1 Tax=Herminiimonas contaminans TaxID=1111140 RepID=A0ABS0ES57_9BURK|nr:hypothetical protein [Herminiimonas contaminans]MBF8177683.1 hypothetical protein [Herminiimonas contaminans]